MFEVPIAQSRKPSFPQRIAWPIHGVTYVPIAQSRKPSFPPLTASNAFQLSYKFQSLNRENHLFHHDPPEEIGSMSTFQSLNRENHLFHFTSKCNADPF